MYFYAFKDGVEVTNKDVEEVIGKHEEFTTKQFLYVYKNYNQVKRDLRKAGLIEERKYNKKRKWLIKINRPVSGKLRARSIRATGIYYKKGY